MQLTSLSQDPTLFSGTLRSNLDPTDEHDDATLWNAVKRCGIAKSSKDISLETPIASSGSNFSQGQRQLIGLARALVRSSRIIIMDEASGCSSAAMDRAVTAQADLSRNRPLAASLDNESDELVQKVIREEFSGCTNLTVAHRLGKWSSGFLRARRSFELISLSLSLVRTDTIIDFDRILVLRAGRVAEFDKPAVLLDRKDSAFRDMVEATGRFDELYERARKADRASQQQQQRFQDARGQRPNGNAKK